RVLSAAHDGDLGCRRVIADAGRAIGHAVATLLNVLNPELVVMGGDLAAAGELLLDGVRESVGRAALPEAAQTAEVVAGVLGDRAGRLLMEGFMWRFHPATEQLRRLVAEGAVGNLRVVRASFGFDIVGRDENVRWSGELDGGALMDVGCYCVSALRLLCGEP